MFTFFEESRQGAAISKSGAIPCGASVRCVSGCPNRVSQADISPQPRNRLRFCWVGQATNKALGADMAKRLGLQFEVARLWLHEVLIRLVGVNWLAYWYSCNSIVMKLMKRVYTNSVLMINLRPGIGPPGRTLKNSSSPNFIMDTGHPRDRASRGGH